jgi:tRNA (guanine37-N1)-methyltransferase
MVTCLKVDKKHAEQARQLLLSHKIFSGKFKIAREGEYVLFPIPSENIAEVKKLKLGTLEEMLLTPLPQKPDSIYDALEGKLSEEERQALITSFDIVGDIAVLEIEPLLEKKEKLIADAVLSVHPNIKVVAKKAGGTQGEFRIRPVKVVAGENRTDTLYRESGCMFHLDLNKTYFSGRLSTERQRIAAQVKRSENILALFAGIGPFPIVIERNAPNLPKKQLAVELNPDACAFLRENIVLNKCKTIEAVEGDVRKVLAGKKYALWADRAIMPLPKSGEEFLASILPCMKKGGIVHFYSFGAESEPYAKAEEVAREKAASCGREVRIICRRIVRPFSPGVVQVVLDLMVS